MLTTLATEAPSVFRIPISFVFCCPTNIDNPNNPRHETKSARIVEYDTISFIVSTFLSSSNEKSLRNWQ